MGSQSLRPGSQTEDPRCSYLKSDQNPSSISEPLVGWNAVTQQSIAPGHRLGPAMGIGLACLMGLLIWNVILLIYLAC